ncbi:hypothetical protein G3U99_23315 [Vibrio coralliilyticus OCN008]|uniref:hypothetical protein n=1 Tax=Vibrio coralliilyticus TaxID=190893 RepID=UPI000391874D|nr:hypothetical protein [Vibrio coralliilyticus]ERB66311.1 hypothetical protein N779_05420 [Vibrio coralliilyticus OCN008]QIJ87164.1 hypothetical protein G3U99_23315 [Vibrio coralliilyticus OCN008]
MRTLFLTTLLALTACSSNTHEGKTDYRESSDARYAFPNRDRNSTADKQWERRFALKSDQSSVDDNSTDATCINEGEYFSIELEDINVHHLFEGRWEKFLDGDDKNEAVFSMDISLQGQPKQRASVQSKPFRYDSKRQVTANEDLPILFVSQYKGGTVNIEFEMVEVDSEGLEETGKMVDLLLKTVPLQRALGAGTVLGEEELEELKTTALSVIGRDDLLLEYRANLKDCKQFSGVFESKEDTYFHEGYVLIFRSSTSDASTKDINELKKTSHTYIVLSIKKLNREQAESLDIKPFLIESDSVNEASKVAKEKERAALAVTEASRLITIAEKAQKEALARAKDAESKESEALARAKDAESKESEAAKKYNALIATANAERDRALERVKNLEKQLQE